MKVNPLIVFRKEEDGSALIFHPDTGERFGLNRIAALIWECLIGQMDRAGILEQMKLRIESVPENVTEELELFLIQLKQRDFIIK